MNARWSRIIFSVWVYAAQACLYGKSFPAKKATQRDLYGYEKQILLRTIPTVRVLKT
jgi:hypothetical protein